MKKFLLLAIDLDDKFIPVLFVDALNETEAETKINSEKGKDFFEKKRIELDSWQMYFVEVTNTEKIK